MENRSVFGVKSDDFGLLYTFLNQHTENCGVYFAGDHIATEWVSGLSEPGPSQFRDTFDPSRGAILGQATFNADSAVARVLLSGFGYDAIRNDRIQNPHDRIVHLQTILQWLGNEVDAPTATDSGLPFENSLAQNYPNPFNPTTTIRYSLKKKSYVSIRIYNVAGQLVRTLVDDAMGPGPHVITWDGNGSGGGGSRAAFISTDWWRVTTPKPGKWSF